MSRRGRLRRRRAARARARGRGGRGDAEALGRPAHRRRAKPAARPRRCSAPARWPTAGLPHLTLDLEEAFRSRVVDEFVRGYGAGERRTLRALQRRGADRRDARARGPARRRRASPPATTRGSPTTARGRCSPRRRRRQGPDATCSRRCRPQLLARLRFPLAELTKPAGARDRRAARACRWPASPRARTSASSPARASARSCAGTAASRTAPGRSSTARTPGRAPPRPSPLHGRPAPRASASPPAPALRARHRRRDEHASRSAPRAELATRSASGSATRPAPRGERVDGVKLRYRSRAVDCAVRAPARPPRELGLELAEPAYGVAPGQTACLLDGDAGRRPRDHRSPSAPDAACAS